MHTEKLHHNMNKLHAADSGERNRPRISLTFDDGPNPYATSKILDILDAHKVKATFFVIGKYVEKYPEIVRETVKHGHLVGNHTYSHKDDFEKGDTAIQAAAGDACLYVRPPFLNLALCKKENEYLRDKKIITASIDTKDYENISPDQVTANALDKAENGTIILFHDSSDSEYELKTRAQKTIIALPKIIIQLKTRNFSLTRIDELQLVFKEI